MYTRNVSLKLKANPFSASEFADIFDREIIPLLRKQKGFHEEISFIAAERNEAVAISFWDKKDSADAYHRKTYPQVLKALSRVVEGTPRVETFEVANSTTQEIDARSL
jgi:heme-degrading monooxygenase HmoA